MPNADVLRGGMRGLAGAREGDLRGRWALGPDHYHRKPDGGAGSRERPRKELHRGASATAGASAFSQLHLLWAACGADTEQCAERWKPSAGEEDAAAGGRRRRRCKPGKHGLTGLWEPCAHVRQPRFLDMPMTYGANSPIICSRPV